MIGKSAAMMRRSSAATRSSSPATGRWMSDNETRIACSLMLGRPGERLDARPHVHEPDVHGEHAPVQVPCLSRLPLLLERPGQPVEDAEALLVSRSGQLERPAQDRLRHAVRTLVVEADAERLRRPQLAFRGPQRLLKLRDGLVE